MGGGEVVVVILFIDAKLFLLKYRYKIKTTSLTVVGFQEQPAFLQIQKKPLNPCYNIDTCRYMHMHPVHAISTAYRRVFGCDECQGQ